MLNICVNGFKMKVKCCTGEAWSYGYGLSKTNTVGWIAYSACFGLYLNWNALKIV